MASAEREPIMGSWGCAPSRVRGTAPGQGGKAPPPEVEHFLVRDVIYTSRAYATMSVSICL